MSWTDSFPVLTDEHLGHFNTTIGPDERARLERLFEGHRSGPESPAVQLIPVSLYPEASACSCCSPDESADALKRILPRLRRNALRSASEHPEGRFRVYLDPRWESAAGELCEAGCEVIVMTQPSSGPNPGLLWRFLAMEDDVPVTFMSLDDLEQAGALMERTTALVPTGLKMWRTPMDRRLNYRPIHPERFGSVQAMPVRDLLCAFVWYVEQASLPVDEVMARETAGSVGSLPLRAKESGRQADWSRSDLAEFFLMSAIYPRAAFDGVLSLIEADDQHSRWQMLDIEYATWANPDSEALFVKPIHPIPSRKAIDFKESTLVASMLARLALENQYPEHFQAWQREMHPAGTNDPDGMGWEPEVVRDHETPTGGMP